MKFCKAFLIGQKSARRPRSVMQFVRRVPYAAARRCQEGYPRWSPKRQFSPAVGKVTGGGKAALRDGVHSPLSLIRNIRSMETGTLVLNAGMVISLIGMSSSDMIFLRSMSILGGCCGMYYNFTRKPPLRPPIIWGLVFLTLHCGKVVQLLFEKRPIAFDTDVSAKMYTTNFTVQDPQAKTNSHLTPTLFGRNSICTRGIFKACQLASFTSSAATRKL